MWQVLKMITDYKGNPRRELPCAPSLPDELNAFYAHFRAIITEACMRAPAVLDDWVITLSVARHLNRSTFTKPCGQTDYQDRY